MKKFNLLRYPKRKNKWIEYSKKLAFVMFFGIFTIIVITVVIHIVIPILHSTIHSI